MSCLKHSPWIIFTSGDWIHVIKSFYPNALLLECPWPLPGPVTLKQLHISGWATPSAFLFCPQQYCLLRAVDRHMSGASWGAGAFGPCFPQFQNWIACGFHWGLGGDRGIQTGNYGRIPFLVTQWKRLHLWLLVFLCVKRVLVDGAVVHFYLCYMITSSRLLCTVDSKSIL